MQSNIGVVPTLTPEYHHFQNIDGDIQNNDFVNPNLTFLSWVAALISI